MILPLEVCNEIVFTQFPWGFTVSTTSETIRTPVVGAVFMATVLAELMPPPTAKAGLVPVATAAEAMIISPSQLHEDKDKRALVTVKYCSWTGL